MWHTPADGGAEEGRGLSKEVPRERNARLRFPTPEVTGHVARGLRSGEERRGVGQEEEEGRWTA